MKIRRFIPIFISSLALCSCGQLASKNAVKLEIAMHFNENITTGYSFSECASIFVRAHYINGDSVTIKDSDCEYAIFNNKRTYTLDEPILNPGQYKITAKAKIGNTYKQIQPQTFTVTQTPVASYTILIYMCGSNLESTYANLTSIDYADVSIPWDGCGYAVKDIKEILSVPNKPDDINIVIETGGAVRWSKTMYGNYGDYDINANALQIHHVGSDQKLHLDKTLPYESMGRSSTLQTFLEFGLSRYPAQKVGLIFWNHGGGIYGVCFDEKTIDDDSLLMKEVTTAVENATNNVNVTHNHLEWVGYDACLMAHQEIAEMNSNYFDYMVCTQELEAGTGWDYSEWIPYLYAKSDTYLMLQRICSGYVNQFDYDENGNFSNSLHYNNTHMMGVLDLSYANEYRYAFENMIAHMPVLTTRDEAHLFASKFMPVLHYEAGMDVADFIKRIKNSSIYNPGSTYIDAVTTAFGKLVSWVRKGPAGYNNPTTYGLSANPPWYYFSPEFTAFGTFHNYEQYSLNFINLYLSEV